MSQSSIADAVFDRSSPLSAVPEGSAHKRGGPEGESRRHAGRRVLAIGAFVLVALGAALAVGTLPKLGQQKRLDTAATQAAAHPPRVTVAVVQRMAPSAERVLPGTCLPLMEAALFARATGFVIQRLVDIGDHVKEGQLLAQISAPDVDDQLAQSKANLVLSEANSKSAQASQHLAKVTLDRGEALIQQKAISPQILDQDKATLETTTAQVASSAASVDLNKATVQRYSDLQSFEKITAPFEGVITSRHVEKGDLITADSTTRELFHLMRTDTLRIFVNVPQTFATSIKNGQAASVYRREEPQKLYPGKVTRTADALDPNTRTLLTEVDVPNPENALRPGMYLQVRFNFDRKIFPIMIPAAALATRTKGPRVAVLDDQQHVRYRDVELGRDYGAELQVLSGLKEGEQVVVHPGDDLPEGTVVQPVPLPKSLP